VGKAKNLKERVSSYFGTKNLGEKTERLVSEIKKIKTIETYSEVASLILEANLIKKYKPKFNIKLTDDKAYLFVKITIKDKYPKILTIRRIEDEKYLYFGPYPNAKSLRLVLKTIRKIFPFQSVANHSKNICLYNHLGLCPCPDVTHPKNYKTRNIKYIVSFLKGENKKIIHDLEKERDAFSKDENFEKANAIQQQIAAIKLITNPQNRVFDYETNPNLASDIKLKEVMELQNILNGHALNIKKLKRIECFDISNFSGKDMVGSMVVFNNGFEQKNEYRRFKINKIKTGDQNDFFALRETIDRRLSHTEWQYPDLIIVDGGKGQVSVISALLSERHLKIPLIGLAKSEEKIITPLFEEIRLKFDSPALLLLRRIRDEAHRFAIAYHKKLRHKNFLN
jgi:excinuclease ABC subunit C